MRYIIMTIFALTISAFTSTAQGSMITFTQTGMSDGYYLETRYDDKPYVFTATGDLSKVHSGGWFGHKYPGYQVDLVAASITVEGMGTVNLPRGYYYFTVSPTHAACRRCNHPTHLWQNSAEELMSAEEEMFRQMVSSGGTARSGSSKGFK